MPHLSIKIQSLPIAAIRQRLKLTHSDVRLILWLIVQIKPFKYVGDRTLSQSRKWDLIQQRFEHERSSASSNDVVPTVRTLQRQMASALRKARNRKLSSHYKPYAVFNLLHLRLPLADLELAVLELHDLSEAYKSGQMVGPLPPHIKEEVDPRFIVGTDQERRRSSNASQLSMSSGFSGYSSAQMLADLTMDQSLLPQVQETTAELLRKIMSENWRFHDKLNHIMRNHATAIDNQLQKLTALLLPDTALARPSIEMLEKAPSESPASSSHDSPEDKWMHQEGSSSERAPRASETGKDTKELEEPKPSPKSGSESQSKPEIIQAAPVDSSPAIKEEKRSSLREVLNW